MSYVAKAPPDDEKRKELLKRIDMRNSYFTRKAAFDELCALVVMELDTSRQ